MLDIFKSFSNKKTSKDVAKDRLKLVLVHDRMDCSPELIEKLQEEIIEVISKYAEIDRDSLDIKMSKCRGENGDKPVSALVANIPIKSLKR
ncbi:cell division topological specificity factor MinE [Peptacetobacter hominis]|uniref:Cell division topological specificity factor n=1 Tax=Peptacetobacter hominis TaxID=2743610 RepID=A0A544QTV7_9FIRM|nr:cell division topological specificity factor MinE [Peptacetobacter hominis]TQQ84129.1 cell division topological specificity factor MinE [Peptacetobacter hominis]